MASAAFEDIADTFEFLDDWEDRYRHVIDLGKQLPPLAEGERVPASKVEGCASQVWLVPEVEGQGEDAILRFRGESDAMIVKGLIAVLMVIEIALLCFVPRENLDTVFIVFMILAGINFTLHYQFLKGGHLAFFTLQNGCDGTG